MRTAIVSLEIAAIDVFYRNRRRVAVDRDAVVSSNDFDLMNDVHLLGVVIIFEYRLRRIENRFIIAFRTI